jgi:hypothetical protein
MVNNLLSILLPWFLQAFLAQFFSEVMAVLWRVACVATSSRLWMSDSHTPKSLQASLMQCFSEVMAVLWLVEVIVTGNATFPLWMLERHTFKFLQV